MTKRSKLIVIGCLFAVVAGGLFLWLSTERGTWRYKITVAVETPEGIKSGSAVREISNSASRFKLLDLPEAGNPADIEGEAVVVDLGERGVLFSLISDDARRRFYYAFGKVSGATTVEGIQHFNDIPDGTQVTLSDFYPKIVTFTDMDDPKSVKLVYAPRRDKPPVDKFEEIFGEGVALKSITVEMTDEPVTRGVVKRLAWLEKINGGYLHGGFTSKGAPLGLHGGNFKKMQDGE